MVKSCWLLTTRRRSVGRHSRTQRPVSGMRACFVQRSITALPIERGALLAGQPPWRYLRPLHANFFIDPRGDVRAAFGGWGACCAGVFTPARAASAHPHEAHRFDGDAVLFSDEGPSACFKPRVCNAFVQHEKTKPTWLCPAGPV